MITNFIEADTHTSEYLMHKYWARKPHNVVNYFLKKYGFENCNILDPFMGSGVTINEALKNNMNPTGIDINPIAVNITSSLTNKININDFKKIVDPIINKAEDICNNSFKTSNGEIIKYAIHSIIVNCPNCGSNNSPETCKKDGRKILCYNCEHQIHFNLENLVSTKIIGIYTESKKLISENKELLIQEEQSNKNIFDIDLNIYNYKCPENKRILAYEGLKTENFFTIRNFSILSYLADEFHKIKDNNIKNLALCLLTASSAQCSRLIPHRNNLTTGGPAWSVPGFWVPQNHLETNPIIHIKARYKKILKGIMENSNLKAKIKPELINDNSIKLLENCSLQKKFDIVFLDPPYGDSVPYTEFSHFWNSFLKKIPNVDEDISVSDRLPKNESWKLYKHSLERLFKAITKNINDNAKIIITFNNNDLKAWKALISPLQKNKFECISVNYQIPAVISSKAAFCPTSSYISDIYSVYKRNDTCSIKKDISDICNKLIKCASSRNGTIYSSVVDREFIISILENNIDCSVLNEKKEIIDSLFVVEDKKNKILKLKKEYILQKCDSIKELITRYVTEQIKKGETSLQSIYKKVAPKVSEYGIPELYEFKTLLDSFIITNDKILGIKDQK